MMPSVKEPLAGLALLVIFGFLIWYNRPIENPRLLDPYPQDQTPRFPGKDAYEAWLWKDPFGFDPAGSGGATEAWAQAAQGKELDSNLRRKVPASLTCQVSLKKVLNLDKKKGEEKPPERIVLAPLVKVAPHTVENKEMRTRQRYAVVAGLVESGYRPQEGVLHFCSIQENRREYDMRWERYRHESHGKSEHGSKGSKPDIIVAWIDSEILTDESKFPADHDCTRRCSFAFKNLLKEISKNNKLYLFDAGNTLDSGRSGQVEKHIQCIHDQNIKSAGINGNVGDIQFLKLAGMEGKEEQVKCDGEASTARSGQAGKEAPESDNRTGQATGGTKQSDNKSDSEKTGSEKLADLLAKELTLRGITDGSEVVTISEQGSENATVLAGDIRKSLSELFAGQKCARSESDDESGAASRPDKIRNVFYLKSFDGNPEKTSNQDKKDKNETRSIDKAEKVPSIDLHHSPPLPIGSGQLDYFHRLAKEIKNVHHTIDIAKRDSGIRAIVILGSDFSDKLLIIEALREKMPHLLILTTELDAQMLHPKHWRSTRNLVVASHFDLRLWEKPKEDEIGPDNQNFWHRAYPDEFPPFRDSQQTNIFYRTLSIAAGDASRIYESAEAFPRIFEVGRNGFVRLGTAEKNNAGDYHPLDNIQENTIKELGLLFAIAVSLIVFHWAIRPWSSLLSGYLFFGTSVLFALAFGFGTDVFSTNEWKDPFGFTAEQVLLVVLIAVSLAGFLWPVHRIFSRWLFFITPAIFVIAFGFGRDIFSTNEWKELSDFTAEQVLFVVLIAVSLAGFLWSLHRIFSRWLFFITPAMFVIAFGFGRDIFSTNELKEPFSFTDGVSLWPTLFIQIIAIFLAGRFFVQATCELEKNFCDLDLRYFRNNPLSFPIECSSKCELWARRRWCLGRWLGDLNGNGLIAFAFLIVTIVIYAWNDVYPSGSLSFLLCTGILVYCLNAYLIVIEPEETVSIKHWVEAGSKNPSGQVNHESLLWKQYYAFGQLGSRIARVVWTWLIFAIIETLLVYLLPPWPLPWRGATGPACSDDMAHLAPWIGVMSFTVTMLLLFFILDAVRLNFYWVRKLHAQNPLLTGQFPGPATPTLRRCLERMVLLVAERTDAVDKLIYYPMFCIMLMLFAKITYFDNQEFPLSKGITFGAAISLLFFSGFVLRREANELRLCVKRRLRDIRMNSNAQEIDETIRRIDAIDEGAFRSMLEQPVMQALLIILASIGLFAGEYLKVFG